MYFPNDMTFQYFFFDTYPGYFLQVLPIALIAGTVYGIFRFRKDGDMPSGRKFLSCLFVCYMTGLVCLVLLLRPVSMMWYRLFYHASSGLSMRFFTWGFDLVPDFWTDLDSQTIGNFLMFLPFGFLYPFFKKDASFGKTLLAGFLCTLGIELFQPVFGRAFDINDIIVNFAGTAVSAAVFFAVKGAVKKK